MVYSSLLFYIVDDGAVKLWKNYNCDEFCDNKKELVTAFQALSDMLPLTRGKYAWQKHVYEHFSDFLPALPASFTHNFVSGMQSFDFSES